MFALSWQMCTQLLPTSQEPSLTTSNLLNTMVGESNNVTNMLNKCVFQGGTGNAWLDVSGIAFEKLQESLTAWDPGSIVVPSRVNQVTTIYRLM